MATTDDTTMTDKLSGLAERLPSLDTKKVATAVGVAGAVMAGAVVARAVRRKAGGDGEETAVFHLRQEGEAWVLELEGSSAPSGSYSTKEEGLTAARELAHQSAPCELVVYRTDGSVQDRHSYDG